MRNDAFVLSTGTVVKYREIWRIFEQLQLTQELMVKIENCVKKVIRDGFSWNYTADTDVHIHSNAYNRTSKLTVSIGKHKFRGLWNKNEATNRQHVSRKRKKVQKCLRWRNMGIGMERSAFFNVDNIMSDYFSTIVMRPSIISDKYTAINLWSISM